MARTLSGFTGMAVLVATPGLLSAYEPEEVPLPILAKIVRILASKVGSPGRIGCTDPRMADELRKQGMTIDGEAPVVWAATLGEVKALRPTRKLILCGRLDFLPSGGGLAIVVEDERPAIYMHMRHLGQCKVMIPPDLYDISSRISR